MGDEDGVIEWERDNGIMSDMAGFFFVRGTFNEWVPQILTRHVTREGLWSTSITIGNKGEEEFQVVADDDEAKIFHPGCARCRRMSHRVLGPSMETKEKTWLITGKPGETCTIEVFQHGTYM